MRAHRLDVVDLRLLAAARRAVEPHAGPDELRGVLVGRGHVDVEAGGGALDRERAHHVVRLEAVHAHDGNLQRGGELEGVGDVGGEVLGHLLALRLVGRVRLVAEGGTGRIHREDEVGGLLALEDGGEARDEAEKGGRVDAGGRQAGVAQEDEVALVEKGHEVDDEKLVHNRKYIKKRPHEKWVNSSFLRLAFGWGIWYTMHIV